METTETLIDRISTEELRGRYGLKSRSTISAWLNKLGINRHKEGKHFFIDREDLKQLDRFYSLLKEGLSISDAMLGLGLTRERTIALPPLEDSLDPSIPDSRRIYLQDLLTTLEALTTAANEGWALPTSALLFILNRRSLPRAPQGHFSLWGFIFVRSPHRCGKQYQWWVRRISPPLPPSVSLNYLGNPIPNLSEEF